MGLEYDGRTVCGHGTAWGDDRVWRGQRSSLVQPLSSCLCPSDFTSGVRMWRWATYCVSERTDVPGVMRRCARFFAPYRCW